MDNKWIVTLSAFFKHNKTYGLANEVLNWCYLGKNERCGSFSVQFLIICVLVARNISKNYFFSVAYTTTVLYMIIDYTM